MESQFSERPEELEAELAPLETRISQELRRLAGVKGLDSLTWETRYGERRSGGSGGVPVIVQWGFQVTAVAPDGGAYALRCFLEENTLSGNPELLERILDLWMDRVEEG